jgi:D-3-phosphoglycerate dehydrogenase / 2-oxoglutarate reductase
MPIVVVTDYTFPALDVEESILRPLGAEVVGHQCKTIEALIPVVSNADVVITQFAPIKADVIAAMQSARAIVRYGIGVDNVDLDAARLRNIAVCNVPDYCIDEVADHTLALILGLTRQVVSHANLLRDGEWALATTLDRMWTLRDQTVGIIGFGRIGREVAARLAPFKCRRLVYDPVVESAIIEAAGCIPASLDDLLAQSDIVTLHCPSTPRTRKMLDAAAFATMKRGTIVVNLARGDLIETEALVAALESGHLGGAALDVCDPEPIPLDSPLRTLPNVIAAPHIASASVKAARKLRETVAGIAAAALRGEPLPNIVNGVK